MSKQQIIDAIREHNPGAGMDFLSRFDTAALFRYLDRLRYMHSPRDEQPMWVRFAETPAVVTRSR
ncbi:MAG: hypothetical protein WD294_04070 [Phycisphaeraceae bacterium]